MDEEENKIEAHRIKEEETKHKTDMETDKEQTKKKRNTGTMYRMSWKNYVKNSSTNKRTKQQETPHTKQTKERTKKKHAGSEAKDDTKTKAGTETKIAHREGSRSKKRLRDENAPGSKDKMTETEAEPTIRKDEKRQGIKETTEDSKGRERT